MCRVYNTIGCLNTIQFDLIKNNIDHFNSLTEIIDFKTNYFSNKQKIISDHTLLVEEEKKILEKDISEFNNVVCKRIEEFKQELREKLDCYNNEIESLAKITSNNILFIKNYWKNLILCLKFWLIQVIFYFKILFFNYQAKKILSKKNKLLKYITINFQEVVTNSSFQDLQQFETTKEIIENLNNTIYGAFGEKKVEDQFKKLSDDYILINDFCYTFETPLFHDGSYIKTIQIDHLLISSSSIFLIETKNWSTNSLNNPDLRSPVQQIRRTNYALFKLLERGNYKSTWNFSRNHWGNRKIPIKNIIVFTGSVPREQFQYIKILGLTELLSYIQYFTPSFSIDETQMIADYLLVLSEQKETNSKLTV